MAVLKYKDPETGEVKVVGSLSPDEIAALKILINTKAPMYTYGTEDLVPGVSPLSAGKLHFVYE